MPDNTTVDTHELKIWPVFFQDWMDGRKRSEIRLDDRGFKVGDSVALKEWDPKKKKYTGRAMLMQILHITKLADVPGIKPSIGKYVVMSLASRKVLRPKYSK